MIANLAVLSLLFLGIVMVLVGYIRKTEKCPEPTTIYKFIPKSFIEEQEQSAPVSEIYADMFGRFKSEFVTGFTQPEPGNINRHFISQF